MKKIFVLLFRHTFTSMLLFFFLFLAGCHKTDDVIPYAYVDFQISVYDPEYSILSNPGNALIINEKNGHFGYFGLNGVILYHSGNDEVFAYEATCTKDLKPLTIESVFMAEDKVCGSRYSLPNDGTVIKGPAEIPLKAYNVMYNSSSGTITVSN